MNRGRLRLLHLREQNEAVGRDMDVESCRFEEMRSAGPTRAVSAFNLFQTPEVIADRMVSLLGCLTDKRVLEPSAGLGRLYRAVRYRFECEIVLVENAPQCAAELFRETAGDAHCRLLQQDFLSCNATSFNEMFDAVLMNPPFKQGSDVKHILHALKFLKPGGLLVSLCYAGVKQRSAFEGRSDVHWEILPAGSFRSEGTRADVAIITVTKLHS
jgi:predicted RNA methylase